jgi:hypothetical protein
MYILYSTRLHGWLSKSSQYTSDRSQARQFERASALEFCRKHKDHSGITLVPINLDDLAEIV